MINQKKITLQNPLSPDVEAPQGVFTEKAPIPHYNSILSRILITFLLLSFIPVVLYGVLGAAVYLGSIREYLPTAEAVTIEKILLTQFFLILLLSIIMMVFAGSLTAGALSRPLQRLLELVRLVGEGKLNYQLKVASHDEIAELTDAFNIMVGKLRNQQSREQLISKLKTEFISVAAHQLRTPLSGIKWTFRMLIDGDVGLVSPEQKQFLQRGAQINDHMIELVNDLLDAARIEEGRFGYTFVTKDFIEYLRSTIERYIKEAQNKHITIHLIPFKERVFPLTFDPAKMDLVFQNFFDNSIKYRRGDNADVTISSRLLPEYLEIAIADKGVGIPAHQLKRIFSKFFRGDNVVRLETEGSGLGLFIVRNIIKNHGGDIQVASEENKGTTMVITLPLSRERIPTEEKTFEDFVGNL